MMSNNRRTEVLYENVNCILNGGSQHDNSSYGKKSQVILNGNGTPHISEKIVYDVPKSNQCIYAIPPQTKNTSNLVDSLVPSAARLILRHNQNSHTRNDILERDCNEFDSDTLDFSGDEEDSEGYVEPEAEEPPPNVPQQDYNFDSSDFKDYSNTDYGLEVIHEETESQMSSSDSESDFDSDPVSTKSQPHSPKEVVFNHDFGEPTEIVIGMSTNASNHVITPEEEEVCDEGVPKHIRISPNWDPEPILNRLYTIPEPIQRNNKNTKETSGFLNILSGNRKKGTFWNAWKRKFYVLAAGKLNGYEKENCEDLFQSVNLVGGKVDFLDPTDFVGADQSKTMTNRIIGIDDAKGHYYVFQCHTAADAGKWVQELQLETSLSATTQYASPILPKSLSLFRDVILVDFGSTNIRAGVLTHQPSLPTLFIPSVMSENAINGSVIYGKEVYLRENRKNAKIKFPIECTSKMCQNNLDIAPIKGFLLKIFKELRVQPERYRIIINLPRRVDNTCKKNILELLFNVFQAKSAMLCHQSVVSFWAYSSDSGIVCDIGERCDIVPVSQGFVLSHAWGRAPFGGHPLRHSLRQGLGPQENGLYLSTPAENLVLRFISENFIYTAHGSRRMSQESQEIVVEMDLRDVLSIPNLIGVNQNVLRGVAEGFFDPGSYGLDCDSLPKLLFKSLQDCGMDIRKEMSQNIFVTGGCTMLPGFVERLEVEVTKLCPSHLKPKIQASPYRYHASFIGASVLSTTDAFERSLVHRKKYDGGPGPSHWLV